MPPPRLYALAREPQLSRHPAPAQKDAGSLAYPTPGLFWALGGFPSSTGVAVSPLTSIQVATVYGCIKARSEDLAKVPLRLKRRLAGGGFELVDEHPIARLLRRPNPWMTPFAFIRFLELSVCFRGNAYVVIQRGRAGEPIALIPVVPDKVVPEIGPTGEMFYRVSHPMLSRGEDQIRLHQDNVLHVRNLSLDAGYVGMSPIAAAQESIGLALAAQQHGAVLFRQGGQMGGVLKHPGVLTQEAKDNISRSFAEKFQGVQNAHKIPVLEENMTFEKIAMTNEDAQFLESRKFQRGEICAIFRVPPHKVMDLEKATFNNMEVSEQSYINDALMPDADQIAQEMEAKCLFDDERDGLFLEFQWDALLRADRLTRYQAHAIGLNNGFLSQNDVRRREGETLIPGGDAYNRPLNIGGDPKPAPTQTPGDMAPNPVPSAALNPLETP